VQDSLTELIEAHAPTLSAREFRQEWLIFEERVRLSCFSCARSGVSWTCPPKIPDVDFRQVFAEYDNALLVVNSMPIGPSGIEEVRRDSSVILHRALLKAERFLWENNCPLAVSFTGGACKLCTDGCDSVGCRQPTLARIPLEATGVNVMESAARAGVEVAFPPSTCLLRIGLLVW
jgi:predicted metal-binding protein